MMRIRRKTAAASQLMMTELAMASMEVIARRTGMMMLGTCSPAEYRRMVREKTNAAQLSVLALMRGRSDAASLLGPWHRRATANAKRLRK
jgi:hypothetical protein